MRLSSVPLVVLIATAIGCVAVDNAGSPSTSDDALPRGCAGCMVDRQCLTVFNGCEGRTCVACAACNASTCDGRCEGGTCIPKPTTIVCGPEPKGGPCPPEHVCSGVAAMPFLCRQKCGQPPAGEPPTCPDGFSCQPYINTCFRRITDRSNWYVVLVSAHTTPRKDYWDVGTYQTDVVLCLRAAGRRFCTRTLAPGASLYQRLPVPYTRAELREVVLELWDWDGVDSFQGCMDGGCTALDAAPKQRIPLTAEAIDRVPLVPRDNGPNTFHDLRFEDATVWLHTHFDELGEE
jgi:hypothetical protein